MATGLEGLGNYLKSAELGAFKPRPYYEKHTDSLIFYCRNERSYGKRLNETMTLFLSLADKSLVGIEIKGIERLCKVGKDRFFVEDKGVPLSILVDFALVPAPDDQSLEDAYFDAVKEAAENVIVEREVLSCRS